MGAGAIAPFGAYWIMRQGTRSESGGTSSSSSANTSSQLSSGQKSALAQKTSFREFTESESTTNENNVVVKKRARDNGSGEIYGPQAGSVDYATGLINFIPTDIARAASWGLNSGGTETTDSSSSGSGSTTNSNQASSSVAGSVKSQLSSEGTTTAEGTSSSSSSSAGTSVSTSSGGSGSSGGESTAQAGQWGSEAFSDEWGNGSLIRVKYATAASSLSPETVTAPAQNIQFSLTPRTQHPIVAGSVMFTFAGSVYVDRNGRLIMDPDPTTGAGLDAGQIDYSTGSCTLSYWNAGVAPNFTLHSCLTRYGSWAMVGASFRTAASPVKPLALSISFTTSDGEQFVASADGDGNITHEWARGKVNYQFGTGFILFGKFVDDPDYVGAPPIPQVWVNRTVDPSTIRYNAVAFSYLPLDASILGLDPVRLPQDGRVPVFRPGGFAVVGHTGTVGPATVSNGQTIDCARVRLSRVRVLGADGNVINTGYTANLEAGTVTFTDVAGYSQPVTIEHRVEDLAMISDAQINGEISFTRPLTHDYPVPGSYISSALVMGDLRARVSLMFDQATWSNSWSDNIAGSAATGTFNDVLAPIEVTNKGAITERWAIRFTNTTSFEVIGEHVGVIAVGNTSADCSPNNPATGTPYFTIPATGWGLGWSTGNVLRFNTVGAMFPVWVLRTVQQGPETVEDDSFTILIRGDVDRP